MEVSSPEVMTKYQKLALEYSKLKAQIHVLKQALTDEKSSGVHLQESVKKKDLLVRKLEQEVDTLNFRNQQLTKRVSVLQDDIEAIDSKSAKGKHSPRPNNLTSSETYNILNVELESRIKENEDLHHQVYTLDMDYKREISELSSTVESLRSELEKKDMTLNEKLEEHKKTISSLLKEKIKVQGSQNNYEKEMRELKSKLESYERELSLLKKTSTPELKEVSNNIETEKFPFNDKQYDSLNQINVPVLQRKRQIQFTAQLQKFCGCVLQTVQQLSGLHAQMQKKIRVSVKNEKVVEKTQQFSDNTYQHLKDIQLNFSQLSTALQKEPWPNNLENGYLKDISALFSSYTCDLDQLLPYLILCIRYDNEDAMTSSPKIKEANRRLSSLLEGLVGNFKKLDTYLQLLFNKEILKNETIHATHSALLKKILSNFASLQQLFDEAKQCFSSKMSLHHMLPTTSEEIKTADECLLTSLVSVMTSFKKLISTIEECKEVFTTGSPYTPRFQTRKTKVEFHPTVWDYKERGVHYASQITNGESESVPYEIALENSQKLAHYSDNQDSLTQQMEEYRSKLSHLELEKENWMLECQFLKAKQSKKQDSPTDMGDGILSPDYESLHLFAKENVNQLIKQIQLADSKVIAYKNESEFLVQKLKLSLQKEKKLENEILNCNKTISVMKEEQAVLMKSYEDQLSRMSDHLANMNDVMALQKEEIDGLKQLAKKGKKSKAK